MYGEIDLESYTLSIIRINTALQKLEDDEDVFEVKELLEESCRDLNMVYKDIVDDLNGEEININEHYLFFQNGKQTFPQYIEALGNVENDELGEVITNLVNVFSNLNKIADAFNQEPIK